MGQNFGRTVSDQNHVFNSHPAEVGDINAGSTVTTMLGLRISFERCPNEGIVLLETGIGGARVLDMLTGDPLPRIC
jgi:hypothetical protein